MTLAFTPMPAELIAEASEASVVSLLALSTVKVVLLSLVMEGASSTVSVNDCVASGDTPLWAVIVNEYLEIGAPPSLLGISLDSAIHLDWQDTPDFSRFKWYRVYSSDYNLPQNACVNWALEGTTVSHEFLAAQLANGVTRCFGVSAVDTLGYESLWSPIWSDTPRPDARNVLQSGFRFWDDLNGNGYGDAGELGLVQDGNRTDIDFRIERDVNDTLWIVPVFSGTSVLSYGPTAALTDIDLAPTSGYSRQRAKMLPGYGYVFEIVEGQDVRYGALRVTHAGTQYAIFDWSFQTDRGNLELAPRAGLATAPAVTGGRVAASR